MRKMKMKKKKKKMRTKKSVHHFPFLVLGHHKRL